ncbi:MAG TPA: response regulator transcription factor [Candidatus Limnocylindria bacterium]|nr:response regulator transcription factor [Candidatus Limnocylindria bacterium]
MAPARAAVTPRAVVVMDNPLARVLDAVLQHGRSESRVTTDPAEFVKILRDWGPHVVLLDLDAHPRFLKLSQTAETGAVPTLVFTRRRDTALKLRAFQEGADDILRIPFLFSEIVARLYALLRRTHGIEVPVDHRLRLDSVEIDLLEDRLHVEDRDPISLTLTESTLLYLLAANAGTIVDREDIITSIWDGVFDVESNAVDRHIRDLRVKLGDTWPASKFIETVPGKGYRWRHTVPAADRRPN